MNCYTCYMTCIIWHVLLGFVWPFQEKWLNLSVNLNVNNEETIIVTTSGTTAADGGAESRHS